MCEQCTYCWRASWEFELRYTPENELICSVCWDAPDWDELQTIEDAAEMHIGMLDDKAHAMAERRAGL